MWVDSFHFDTGLKLSKAVLRPTMGGSMHLMARSTAASMPAAIRMCFSSVPCIFLMCSSRLDRNHAEAEGLNPFIPTNQDPKTAVLLRYRERYRSAGDNLADTKGRFAVPRVIFSRTRVKGKVHENRFG